MAKYEGHINVEVVFQAIDKLPEGFSCPNERTKPWGPAHAVIMADKVIQEPFAVINSDDFYGRNSFEVIAKELMRPRERRGDYCMVGFRVGNTMTENKVVSYVNTSVGVKALTDVCRTSTNALKVVESIPREQPIIFAPDRNLGSYIQRVTGRDNMVIWDGACLVHEEFSLEGILRLKAEHPEAKVVVHPECKAELVAVADYVGSTAGILDYCKESDAEEFIVVTESGILVEMEKRLPAKQFIPAPTIGSEGGCNECHYMKMVTLENILSTLENKSPEVTIDEPTRKAAEQSILNMVSIK